LELDLSNYHQFLVLSEEAGKRYIHDPVRKKKLVLQPEELVRQTWIQYLYREQGISYASLGVEKQITIASKQRRYDLVYYLKGRPHILFEFKSYKLALKSDNAHQIGSYNLELQVPFLIISNGIQSLAYSVSQTTQEIKQLDVFPPIS